ncbi:ribonuclease H-like domain-containing protein [Tanacetum coccineum]
MLFFNGALLSRYRSVVNAPTVGYATRAGFYHSRCDSSLFIYRQGSQVAYLLIYVDDIILTASCPALLQQIIVGASRICGYSNPSRTPVDTESNLGPDGVPVQDPTMYRSLARGLQYLIFTRPDLSYVVQQICFYMHDPREPHLAAFKRILRYVQGTLDLGLHLYASSTTSLVGYTDVDWAGCPSTRRSTSAETVWLRNLLRELHSPLSTAILVYCDNVSAVYMSVNPVQHQRTKHIEIDIHFVRDMVTAGQVRVLHVPSRFQYADIFTKGLPSTLFEEFRSSLSVWIFLPELVFTFPCELRTSPGVPSNLDNWDTASPQLFDFAIHDYDWFLDELKLVIKMKLSTPDLSDPHHHAPPRASPSPPPTHHCCRHHNITTPSSSSLRHAPHPPPPLSPLQPTPSTAAYTITTYPPPPLLQGALWFNRKHHEGCSFLGKQPPREGVGFGGKPPQQGALVLWLTLEEGAVLGRLSELKTTIDVGLLDCGNLMETIGKQYEQWSNLSARGSHAPPDSASSVTLRLLVFLDTAVTAERSGEEHSVMVIHKSMPLYKSEDRYHPYSQQGSHRSHGQSDDRQKMTVKGLQQGGVGKLPNSGAGRDQRNRVSRSIIGNQVPTVQVPSEGYTHPVSNTCGRRHPGECESCCCVLASNVASWSSQRLPEEHWC